MWNTWLNQSCGKIGKNDSDETLEDKKNNMRKGQQT
jgi:hypothetical protein